MPVIDEAFLSSLTLEPVIEETSEQQDEAFKKIVKLLCVRDRCSNDLVERLVRSGFDRCDAESAVERAAACGMVDDVRYADILIRSRISQGKGKAGIEDELAKAHIAPDDIPGWPEAYFPDDGPSEEERAFELLCRKPPRSKNIYAAACRKLASRGFSSDAVFSAARRYAERCR
ncbi:MAG: regulatory protein RecX [Slackia sp.]|nr:regulatory protein RecX [Slackia sp.]